MREELKDASGNVFITITEDDEIKWVHTNWVGFLTEDKIKQVGWHILLP